MSENIVLSITIVTWNSQGYISKCIDSIKCNCNIEYEIIVVDNNSTDNTVSIINEKYKNVSLIVNNENIGFAKAQNIGISRAKGIYVLILNPDIMFMENSIETMINLLESNNQIGMVGCKLLNHDGSIQKSYSLYDLSIRSTIINDLLSLNKVIKIPNSKSETSVGHIEVKSIIGACMLLESSFLKKQLHGFDERFYMYREDADLCDRVRENQKKVIYTDDSKMVHFYGASSVKQKRSYFVPVLQRESGYRYLLKKHSRAKALIYKYLWLFISISRFPMIILYCLYSVLFNQKNLSSLRYKTIKYAKIISWSLGFEKWVSEDIPE